MKYVALAAIAAACVGSAHAQNAGYGYLEGAIGGMSISTIETKDFAVATSAGTIRGHGELDYQRDVTTGVEAGATGFFNDTVWFGVSWDYINSEFKNGRIVGTLNGVTQSAEFTAQEARAAGLVFDNEVHVYQVQSYYVFPKIAGNFRPYLGLGAGVAAVEHARDVEAAASVTAGVRYDISKSLYLGVRARLHYITGPDDELGAEYRPITASTASVILGTKF